MSSHDPDPLWERIREETARHASEEPMLASFLHATILNHTALEDALSFHLANQLDSATASSLLLREVILQAMEIEAREEPSSDDWYVFGRIAEHYGEIEVAVAAYQKVEPPDPETADATYHLAQRRLGVLGQAETSVH